MPSILLVMSYLLKIFVDRSASLPDAIRAFLELPVDIVFLATTLIVGFSIMKPENAMSGMAWFGGYIIGAFVVVILWRRSVKFFETEKYLIATPLVLINYTLCAYGLMRAIDMVTGG